MSIPGFQVEEIRQRLDQGNLLFLLYLRNEYEYEIPNIEGQLIPLVRLSK